jgi:hypothetical protein
MSGYTSLVDSNFLDSTSSMIHKDHHAETQQKLD